MEVGYRLRVSSWLISGLLTLGFWSLHFSCVEPLDCPSQILPSRVNEILSARQRGFTLTSKSAQFLYSYWRLQFEVAPFLGTSLLELWAWIPIAPHATELILEFMDLRRGTQKYLLGSFPIIFPSYPSNRGCLLEIYCLVTYWMEVVPSLLAEEKTPSTEFSDAKLNACSNIRDKRDVLLLFVSISYAQPPLFHLPYVQEPFIPNMEQLILGPSHKEMVSSQPPPPTEKLCHLWDRRVNLHRAAWGQCIVAPKSFSFPSCQGICLAMNKELLDSNFECYKRDVPICSWLFQACVPVKVRPFSLMVQDDEYNLSVHYTNISLIEKCGCS